MIKRVDFTAKYFVFIFVFTGVFAGQLIGQEDTTFFNKYKDPLTLKISISNKFVSLLYENNNNEITFDPNRPISLGLGVNFKKMGISFCYGLGFLSNDQKGETHSFDIQYHNYGTQFCFDVIGQVYTGFYDDDYELNGNYQVYKNLKAIKFGFFGQYIFNSFKFSYHAAFSQKGIQKRSAGSFLLGGGIYYSQIQSEIPQFFIDSTQTKINNIQLGTSVGYAYTWVLSGKMTCSLALSVGFNGGVITSTKQFMIYPTAIPRFSIGYNGKRWSCYIHYGNNLIYTYYSPNFKMALSSGEIQLSFVKRFEKIPFWLSR